MPATGSDRIEQDEQDKQGSTTEAMSSTYTPKASEIERQWLIVDADGQTLGRLATRVASLLAGKHKATYATHMDVGDHVIVINAEKIKVTGNKLEDKKYYRHSGYPGGFREE
jgi:large subunit ribosomal protein L13